MEDINTIIMDLPFNPSVLEDQGGLQSILISIQKILEPLLLQQKLQATFGGSYFIVFSNEDRSLTCSFKTYSNGCVTLTFEDCMTGKASLMSPNLQAVKKQLCDVFRIPVQCSTFSRSPYEMPESFSNYSDHYSRDMSFSEERHHHRYSSSLYSRSRSRSRSIESRKSRSISEMKYRKYDKKSSYRFRSFKNRNSSRNSSPTYQIPRSLRHSLNSPNKAARSSTFSPVLHYPETAGDDLCIQGDETTTVASTFSPVLKDPETAGIDLCIQGDETTTVASTFSPVLKDPETAGIDLCIQGDETTTVASTFNPVLKDPETAGIDLCIQRDETTTVASTFSPVLKDPETAGIDLCIQGDETTTVASTLSPVLKDADFAAPNVLLLPKELENQEEEEFQVEKVLNKRIKDGEIQYYLKWVNYTKCTWEPIQNLNCAEMICQYEASVQSTKEAQKKKLKKVNRPQRKTQSSATKISAQELTIAEKEAEIQFYKHGFNYFQQQLTDTNKFMADMVVKKNRKLKNKSLKNEKPSSAHMVLSLQDSGSLESGNPTPNAESN